MKATAAIVASSALISLSQAACPLGHATLTSNGRITPMGVCIAQAEELNGNAAANGDGGIRATRYTCDQNGVYAETFSDYNCATSLDGGNPQVTTVFQDGNGNDVVTCESVDACDYYHTHGFTGSDGVFCGDIASAVTADDRAITSQIWISQISNEEFDVNFCGSDGNNAFQNSMISEGMCDANTATTGTFITTKTYDDNSCSMETTNGATTTQSLTLALDNAVSEDGAFVCRFWVECSDAGIITSAPTMAPTEAPSAAPSASPTAAPSAAPTAAPSGAPSVAPSAAPTAAPVVTDAPSAAPSAAPTTASSANQSSASIVALLIASYYAIIA